MLMTVGEAIAYIENQKWSSTKVGLERTRELADRLGDPQKKLKFIHITGSNGKGSTARMLESILREAGYTVGLYTSPHLLRFNERICVDGEEISDIDLARITEEVAFHAEQMSDHPSQFELSTCIAFIYFLEKQCDIVVLEVGMGGALDSTNVIDAPEVAVITNIGLEHTEYLGNTIEEIAATKSGIIKSGCSAVCFPSEQAAVDIIKKVCADDHVLLRVADFTKLMGISSSLDGQDFIYKDASYHLSLCGEYQEKNAAVALECVRALRGRGWEIPVDAVKRGLAKAQWPARFEVLSRKPLVILDGGHNPQCARAFRESLDELLKGYRLTLLIGMLKDKDYPQVIEILGPRAAHVITLTPDSPRALKAGELAAFFRGRGFEAVAKRTVKKGIETALETEEADRKAGETKTGIIMFGSLYLAGHLREEYLRLKSLHD